ncbi:DUF488 domain-containing protein [Paenalcaligenes sp. Me52]|uniref:DUF488 domain-containing protein n=1 Tax=Paenalcaligenes sp. Me52 TaxID=3392038 RepID=UPI003D266F7D
MVGRVFLDRIQHAIHHPAVDHPRVLTDRLWPRGLRKEALGDIQWYKEASPSTELRKAFHAGELDVPAFQIAYTKQLLSEASCLDPLLTLLNNGDITLLTATKDASTSYLSVLKAVLLDRATHRHNVKAP